jgi:hypothetical protein
MKNREFFRVNRFLTCRSLLFAKKRVYTVLYSNHLYLNSILLDNANNINTIVLPDSNKNEPNESKENQNNDINKNINI